MPTSKKLRSKTMPRKAEKGKKNLKKEKPKAGKKKECLHIGKIAPTNVLEQQILFFTQNCKINPILTYPEGCNLIAFKE